jgi:monofunctional biosynthetic peptidoglycan transglycosylase
MRPFLKVFLYLLIGLALGALVFEIATFPPLSRLKTQNPASSSLIDTRAREALKRGEQPKRWQTWVSLDRISPNLLRAVLAGEDTNFSTHNGFDYGAIQKAWEQAQRDAEREAKQEGDDSSSWIPQMPDFKRGASTITQQLAKNLYLSNERSFVRKGQEAIITFFLERELSKRRILELYLNIIEWGDGVYGAEAASQYYFHKPAANLNVREAAYLSAMIPNPRTVFNPLLHQKRVVRRQRIIMRGMPYVKLPSGTD